MVKYYGRAKMRIGAVNTNQISFTLSGTGSSVGARTRYTKKRVCNNLKVCGDVHYQGRIWSNNQKKDGKCGSCLPATTTCPTAGGVGRINAPRLLCGNNYKNNESATFNIITTEIRRVIIGDNTQNLGLATINGNDPVEFGLKNINSIDPDISPANFSINQNTGMLKFINSNLNSKKFKSQEEGDFLPMAVIELTITATKNNGDSGEKTIIFWEGVGEGEGTVLYNEDVSLNRNNCYTGNTDTQVIYYYLEDSDTLSVNYSLPQLSNPENVADNYEDFARAFSSILIDNQGNAINTKIQSVSGTRGNRLETQVTIENNSIKEIQQTVGGDKMSVCGNLANWGINVKENETVFSGNILNESELKIKINHIREKLSLDTNSIDQSTGTIKPNSILASTLNCIGQTANGYLSHGMWNPYINADIPGAGGKPPINGQDIRTFICGRQVPDDIPCSPYMNFMYGWVWGLGDHYPSTYLPPLNTNFSINLNGAPPPLIQAACFNIIPGLPLFPEANNFAVGGSTFLSTTQSPTQNPITPNLKGGDTAPNGETVPLRSPLVIRAFYFDNDNGDATSVLVPGRCEFISLNSECQGPYTGNPPTPLSCSTSNLPQELGSRTRELPVFNNLLNYILDPTSTLFNIITSGETDNSIDYDTVEIENKTLCIMACATQGQVSQDNIQNVPPPKWFVFNAGLFDNENDVTLFLEGYYNFKNLDQGAARGAFVGEFDASGLDDDDEDKSLINADYPAVLGQEFLGCKKTTVNGNTVYETWGEADIKLADDKKSVTIDYKTISEFGDGSGGITRDEKEIGSQTISAIN